MWFFKNKIFDKSFYFIIKKDGLKIWFSGVINVINIRKIRKIKPRLL